MEPLHVALYGLVITAVGGSIIAALWNYIVKPFIKAAESISSVSTIAEQLAALVEINNRQTQTITTTGAAIHLLMRAMRNFAYALREVGCNGSVTEALKHIERSEDLMTGRAEQNSAAAMTAEGV